MKLRKIILTLVFFATIYSCADYRANQEKQKPVKQYYSSSGFALVYDDKLFIERVVNKKIDNEDISVMHSSLKANTPVQIINPANSKIIKTKIFKKADYPKIFNVVISKKIALILELDLNNPYVEINEIKRNKIFVAKKSNTFDEEKNVATKVPVDEIKINDLTKTEPETEKKMSKITDFILVINDFYYIDTANNLKTELIKKTKMTNISVKKINDKKYRLFVGPFKNFNALKTTYISLNNLGFENLNIYKD